MHTEQSLQTPTMGEPEFPREQVSSLHLQHFAVHYGLHCKSSLVSLPPFSLSPKVKHRKR